MKRTLVDVFSAAQDKHDDGLRVSYNFALLIAKVARPTPLAKLWLLQSSVK